MTCPQCNAMVAPGAVFCPTCGAGLSGNVAGMPGAGMPNGGMPMQQQPMMGYGAPMGGMPMQPARTSGMAIAGFVLSFFCGILGLIFSIMGRNECRNSGGAVGGQGLATAGIVISIIHLALGVIYAIFVVALVGSASHGHYNGY